MSDYSTELSTSAEETSSGWLDSMKLHFNDFVANVTSSKAMIAETLAFFAAGFAIGFIAKRYLRQMLIGIIILVVVIKGLEYAGIGTLALNWSRMKELTGVASTDTVGAIFQAYFAWLQLHIRQTAAVVVGLLVGSRVG